MSSQQPLGVGVFLFSFCFNITASFDISPNKSSHRKRVSSPTLDMTREKGSPSSRLNVGMGGMGVGVSEWVSACGGGVGVCGCR